MANYFCRKCGSQATKPPVKQGTATHPEDSHLGKWSCPKCGRDVAVRREKA